MTNSDNLTSSISKHYKSLELKEQKLEALLAMNHSASDNAGVQEQEQKTEKSSTGMVYQLWQKRLAIAATILLVAFSTLQFTQTSNTELRALISKEIALNHNKQLLPEFATSDYASLASAMNKLDFSPTEPQKISGSGFQLIGARYCSINGQLATQLKLLNDKGELYTLYQTQLNSELSKLPQDQYQVDGVLVEQWQENGLFFGLAKSI